MRRKTLVTSVALILGLALGTAFGPSLRASIASAQTVPPGQAQQSTATSLRTLFLDKLAAALNIPRATLDTAITTAGTQTADSAVQQGTLTQAQADALKQRVQQDGSARLAAVAMAARAARASPVCSRRCSTPLPRSLALRPTS